MRGEHLLAIDMQEAGHVQVALTTYPRPPQQRSPKKAMLPVLQLDAGGFSRSSSLWLKVNSIFQPALQAGEAPLTFPACHPRQRNVQPVKDKRVMAKMIRLPERSLLTHVYSSCVFDPTVFRYTLPPAGATVHL